MFDIIAYFSRTPHILQLRAAEPSHVGIGAPTVHQGTPEPIILDLLRISNDTRTPGVCTRSIALSLEWIRPRQACYLSAEYGVPPYFHTISIRFRWSVPALAGFRAALVSAIQICHQKLSSRSGCVFEHYTRTIRLDRENLRWSHPKQSSP